MTDNRMRVLCFSLGVVATLVVLSVSGALQFSRDSKPPASLGPSASNRQNDSAVVTELEPPLESSRVALRESEAASSGPTVDRVSIPSTDELERRIIAEVIADLPPDWVTPIKPPATGTGPTKGGLPHGEWSIHHPRYDWTEKGRFVFGSKQGRWKMYDASGKHLCTWSYRNGKLDGEVRQLDPVTGEWNTWQYRDGERQE